jgi:prepilin-type N-terminal cleavage/methylation domain-containing protein
MKTIRAFSLAELMIVIAITAIIAAIAIPNIIKNRDLQQSGVPQPAPEPKPKIITEVDGLNLEHANYGQIIVLPTGERILILNPASKYVSGVLLPPLPVAKVER